MSAQLDMLGEPTSTKPRAPSVIYQGEALSVLQGLPDNSVDAVITDPPYSSGGAFRGDRMKGTNAKYENTSVKEKRPAFTGDNRDQRAYLMWCTLWLSECLRIAKEGSPILVFTDWRQLPITTDALQAGGWVWRGLVPWDKTSGRPVLGRFTNQCEYVAWGSKGPMPMDRNAKCLKGVVTGYPAPSKKHHIAGKPVDVMRQLVKIVEPGGVVLDPFAGSGSTGVAAQLEGLGFIGVEMMPGFVEIAQRRIAEVVAS